MDTVQNRYVYCIHSSLESLTGFCHSEWKRFLDFCLGKAVRMMYVPVVQCGYFFIAFVVRRTF